MFSCAYWTATGSERFSQARAQSGSSSVSNLANNLRQRPRRQTGAAAGTTCNLPARRHLCTTGSLTSPPRQHQAPTLVLRPFWWPINMKETPSMLPMPHTMAGSSRPPRSPCSSTNCRAQTAVQGVIEVMQGEGAAPCTQRVEPQCSAAQGGSRPMPWQPAELRPALHASMMLMHMQQPTMAATQPPTLTSSARLASDDKRTNTTIHQTGTCSRQQRKGKMCSPGARLRLLRITHLVGDVERNVQEGGAVGVARHLQPLDGRPPAVRVLAQLQCQNRGGGQGLTRVLAARPQVCQQTSDRLPRR